MKPIRLARFRSVLVLIVACMVPLCARGGLAFTTLVSFDGNNGHQANAGLVQGRDGSFYGTTVGGGAHGLGTIFRITADGTFTNLYSFTGGADGSAPMAALAEGDDGNFYGTTSAGAQYDWGSIFKIGTNGVLNTLTAFDGTNGVFANAALLRCTNSDFYGISWRGGANGLDDLGTVFKVKTNGSLTTLVSFRGTNGMTPRGALMQAADGNLYGTTSGGGASSNGTVFKMTPEGSLTVLASFSGTNGTEPHARLIQTADGSFYGTTYYGGAFGNGVIFRLSSDGTLTNVYSFAGGVDGAQPEAGLTAGTDGNFYGTTQSGGSSLSGIAFKAAAGGEFAKLFTFGGIYGSVPLGGLIQGTDGNFYGTAASGGAYGSGGTVFRLSIPLAPVLQTLIRSNNTLMLTWTSVVGQEYQLQCNSDLATTNWTDSGAATVASNVVMATSDGIGLANRKFYRVVVLP